MKISLIEEITKVQFRNYLLRFSPGDILKIYYNLKEGNKFRIQIFEGVVIKLQGIGISKSITIRKISNGIGIEKKFPIHSPLIDKIEILKYGKVRRAKIYYIRNRTGKSARIKEIIKKNKKILIKKIIS